MEVQQMDKIRGANHHGRGKGGRAYSPHHIDRNRLKEAKHIDPARTPQNRYWMWRGEWQQPGDCEAAERAYYREAFADGQEAQNERYRRKGNHSRVRTTDQVYDVTTTSPEGTLLYIGSLRDGLVDPADLWACGMEYMAWEQTALGDYYKPLTLGMHLDEKGQYHLELRSVYQYQDADGHWRPGQNAALEAAGVPLPDPSQPRGKNNNRKMTWDAARREAWLDVLEAHGYQVERVPEKGRPHMGLEAWQAYQDAKADLDTQAEQQQRTQEAQAHAVKEITANRQAAEALKASTEKWAADLAAWRDGEQRRLDGIAAQIAAPSDADILAELSRIRLKNGRTLREDIEARLQAKAAPVTVEQPPNPDAALQVILDAQAEQRRLQEKWDEQQARNQHQGPGLGG